MSSCVKPSSFQFDSLMAEISKASKPTILSLLGVPVMPSVVLVDPGVEHMVTGDFGEDELIYFVDDVSLKPMYTIDGATMLVSLKLESALHIKRNQQLYVCSADRDVIRDITSLSQNQMIGELVEIVSKQQNALDQLTQPGRHQKWKDNTKAHFERLQALQLGQTKHH